MAIKTPEELQEQLYQERFDRLDEKLDDIKDMLGNKASAGSVLRLETKVKHLEDSHIPCATVMIVKKQLEDLEAEFKPIKEATASAVFFSKHPKLLKMTLIGAFVLLVVSAAGFLPTYFMWKNVNLQIKKSQMEQINSDSGSNYVDPAKKITK